MWAPVAAAILCVLLIWASGLGRGQWVWERLEMNGLHFGDAENKTFSLAQGDSYGELNSGPKFSLPAGEYQLMWVIQTDTENSIQIRSSNGARIEPAVLTIEPNQWKAYGTFTLLDDAENLELIVCFENGTTLAIHDFELRMPCTDRGWLLTLLAAAVCVLYVLERRGYLTAERKKLLLLLGVAVLVASIPALRENLNAGHDAEFHRSRLRNAVSALSEGQIPVRVGGYMYNGYGGASSIFYPDLWLYGPALMMIGGASIQLALSVLLIAINAISAATMYAFAKRVFGSSTAGAAAAILYVLAPYRLTDLYTRMALGEAAAMAVIPLFLLGLWEVIYGDRSRWRLLAAGATAVFMSHMLSTVLCAVLAVFAGACGLRRIVREKRTGAIAKAIAATLALNVFYLVPLLDYMAGGISMGALLSSCADAALEPVALLAADPGLPANIGAALLLCTAATAYALIGAGADRSAQAWGMIALSGMLLVMTTELFPWGALEGVLGENVNYLQFPWRLMMFVDVFLAAACGYGLSLMQEKRQWKDAALIALMLCVIASTPQIERYAVEDVRPYHYWKSNSSMVVAYKEYTLPGSSLNKTKDYAIHTEGGVAVEAYEKRGTRVSAQVKAETEAKVSLPMFGYDGYRALLDGETLAWERGENNRLTVCLPAGAEGELLVWFAGKAIWRIADAVSLAAAIGLLVPVLRRRRAAAKAK